MRSVVLMLLLAWCANAGALTRGHVVDQATFLKQFPWAVIVYQRNGTNICTGALISPTWVITAAHCTGPGRVVRFGNTLRAEAKPMEVRRAIRHPKYFPERLLFDVGLLELVEPVDLRPVPLITQGEHLLLVAEGTRATLAGWGHYRGTARYSARLMTAEVELADLAEEVTFLVFSAESMPCAGDSGGPLSITGLDAKPVLTGIASGTELGDCGEERRLSAYTSVSMMLDFINEHVDNLP